MADLLPLSVSLARNVAGRVPTADLDELRGATAEALCRAAHRWITPYCEDRGYWPWDPDDPSKPEKHWPGYAIKTMKGALLDWARSADRGVSRTQRKAVKAMNAAADDGIRGEAEQAAAAGLTVAKAREAKAAAALTTVSLDDQDLQSGAQYAGGAVTDIGADVESQVTTRALLNAVVTAMDALPQVQAVIVALVFHQHLDIAAAAGAVHLEAADARRQLEQALCEIHQAMLRCVT